MTYIALPADLYETVAESPALYLFYSAKASHTQFPGISLRSDTQALCLIASIPLIQRREKHCFREEKSTFT